MILSPAGKTPSREPECSQAAAWLIALRFAATARRVCQGSAAIEDVSPPGTFATIFSRSCCSTVKGVFQHEEGCFCSVSSPRGVGATTGGRLSDAGGEFNDLLEVVPDLDDREQHVQVRIGGTFAQQGDYRLVERTPRGLDAVAY